MDVLRDLELRGVRRAAVVRVEHGDEALGVLGQVEDELALERAGDDAVELALERAVLVERRHADALVVADGRAELVVLVLSLIHI